MAVGISDLTHFRLLAEVRWQVFRNSLRVGFKRMEALLRGLIWVGAIAVSSLIALLFGFMGYILVAKRPYALHLLLWFLAVFWQLVPLVLEGSNPALDFRDLARYPIRFRLFYFMSVAYGLLDPAALACVGWLASLGIGIIMRDPAAAPGVVIFFTLFVILNLLFNRVLVGWLRILTSTRRRREWLMVGGVLALLVFQVIFWTWVPRAQRPERDRKLLPVLQEIDRYSPMGITANAVTSPREGGLVGLATLGASSAALALLLYRQLRPIYLGEVGSDSEVRRGAIQVQPGWNLPFAGPEVSAMVEREVRYFFRESRLWVNQVSIWTFILVAALAPEFLQRAFGMSMQRRGELLYPIAISYGLIVLATLSYNCFWSDAGGYYRWLLSPVSMRRVLLGKNIFFALAAAVNLLVITAIVSIGVSIPLLMLFNGLLTTAFIALMAVSAGNMLSGWFPKRIKSGTFNTKNASEAATIIGLLVLGAASALCFGAGAWGKLWQQPLLTPALLLVLVLLGLGTYFLSLKLAAEYLASHQDKMCDELA